MGKHCLTWQNSAAPQMTHGAYLGTPPLIFFLPPLPFIHLAVSVHVLLGADLCP